MSNDKILVNPDHWDATSTTTSTQKSNSDDLLNELFKTLTDFMNEMQPLFFVSSINNLKTAMEDFGHGMSAALGCVSVDLQVVASGLASAAVAFAATDKSLADTFAKLDTQLGYYTSTTTGIHLAKPTGAEEASLSALSATPDTSASSDWYSNLFHGVHVTPPPPYIGIPILIIAGIVIIGLSPVGA